MFNSRFTPEHQLPPSPAQPQARPQRRGRAGSLLLARAHARLCQEAPLELQEAPGSWHGALPAAAAIRHTGTGTQPG